MGNNPKHVFSNVQLCKLQKQLKFLLHQKNIPTLNFLTRIKNSSKYLLQKQQSEFYHKRKASMYFRGLRATFDSTKLLIEGAFSLTIPKSTIPFFGFCVYQFQLPNFFNIYLYAYQIFFTS